MVNFDQCIHAKTRNGPNPSKTAPGILGAVRKTAPESASVCRPAVESIVWHSMAHSGISLLLVTHKTRVMKSLSHFSVAFPGTD